MGQGATGIGDRANPAKLVREVEDVRGNLGEIIGELDRRRHEAFDLRLQWRRHKRGLTIAMVCASVLLIGARLYRRRTIRHAPGIGARVLAAVAAGAAGVYAKQFAKETLRGRH